MCDLAHTGKDAADLPKGEPAKSAAAIKKRLYEKLNYLTDVYTPHIFSGKAVDEKFLAEARRHLKG